MLKIVKELMEHKGYSVMQNHEYWVNDVWTSFESIVEYVSKELPKLFASEIRCGLYNLPDYKYIRDYRDLIGMDVKAGFNIVLTDEEVEEKGINISNGFTVVSMDIDRYLSTYLKVTYWYKLRPEKRITVYYPFGRSDHNLGLLYITGKGPTRLAEVENKTRFYSLLIYLLVNSIEIKTPDDFSELDIVVPTPFWHVSNEGMHRLGLMEVCDLIKEQTAGSNVKDVKRLNELAKYRDDILRDPLETILNVTEKVLHEVLSKEANDQIDAKKKADIEEQKRLEAYQEKLRKEREKNTRRAQRHSDWDL